MLPFQGRIRGAYLTRARISAISGATVAAEKCTVIALIKSNQTACTHAQVQSSGLESQKMRMCEMHTHKMHKLLKLIIRKAPI